MLKVSESVDFPCRVISNHPSLGGEPLEWTANVERLGADIMAVHNYVPKLDHIPVVCEQHLSHFQQSVILDDDYKDVVDADVRRCSVARLGAADGPDDLTPLALMVSTIEGQFLQAYLGGVNPHATVRVGSGYDLLRYEEGGFYKEHCDVVSDHPVLGHRRLSFVLFVNDDYEGGELYFPRQDILVKPEKGMALFFPSGVTHPHGVRPVLKGTRYTIVSWFF